MRSASAAVLFLAGAIGGLTACHSQPTNAAAPERGNATAAKPTRTTAQSTRETPSTSAPADPEPYLFELVQKQPYRDTYAALLKQVQPPQDYLTETLEQKVDNYKALYSPSEKIVAGGSTYRVALACPDNEFCSEYGAAFLFAADGKTAWAEVRDGDKPVAYLGDPDDAQKQALDGPLDR